MQSAAFDMLIEPVFRTDPALAVLLAGPDIRCWCSGAVIQVAAQGVDTLGTVPTDTDTVKL